MGKKKTPAINSSSTADIAFLLLCYFLMTTTMGSQTGLARRLPPMPDQNQKTEDTKVNKRTGDATEVEWVGLTNAELLKLCDLGKSALADAIIAKNPGAVKADINRYVEQFFDSTEGTPHFVRTK